MTASAERPAEETDEEALEIAPESVADTQLARRLVLARRVLIGSLAGLAVVAAWLLVEDGVSVVDIILAVTIAVLSVALYEVYVTTEALTRHRLEREASIRRIVSGLSRSLSPESVVETVISDLRAATDADHVVVARVSEPDKNVEVTLVAAHADAPPSRTTLRPEIDGPRVISGEADAKAGEGVGSSAGDSTDEAAAAVLAHLAASGV